MGPVIWILSLFIVGLVIAGLAHLSWLYANKLTKKERLMSRKAKFTGIKWPRYSSRVKEIVHLDYLRVYHEVLKYEEILDIDLDTIYNAVLVCFQRKLAKDKMSDVPETIDIEIMIKEVMDKLVKVNK